jgi:integrase
VHKVLADAVDADLIARNVAERAKPPRPNRGSASEIQSWDADQLRLFLLQVEGSRLEAVWRLAAMTGMRRGELLGLRWRGIDLRGARLSVRQALVAVGYDVIESTPKSHKARTIDLDAETVQKLCRHRRAQDEERAEWGADYRDRDLVVAKENGDPIHPHTFSQSFERLVQRARLRPIRLHDLRHTHPSLALKAGVPLKVVSERLGHESPAFTLKQHAHVLPAMQAEAARAIASLIADDGSADAA